MCDLLLLLIVFECCVCEMSCDDVWFVNVLMLCLCVFSLHVLMRFVCDLTCDVVCCVCAIVCVVLLFKPFVRFARFIAMM